MFLKLSVLGEDVQKLRLAVHDAGKDERGPVPEAVDKMWTARSRVKMVEEDMKQLKAVLQAQKAKFEFELACMQEDMIEFREAVELDPEWSPTPGALVVLWGLVPTG